MIGFNEAGKNLSVSLTKAVLDAFEEVVRQAGIGVDEKEVLSSGLVSAEVSLVRDIALGAESEAKRGKFMLEFFGSGKGSIWGVTINDNGLEVGESLLTEIGEQTGEVVFFVEGGDDDREEGVWRHLLKYS